MSKTVTEDLYCYRIKRILDNIKTYHGEEIEEYDGTFEEWLYNNKEVIGIFFLDDIVTYMGFEDFE